MNPYEAPQTIDHSLPPAMESVERDDSSLLPNAAKICSIGGWLCCAGYISLSVPYFLKLSGVIGSVQREYGNGFTIASWSMLILSVFVNTRGCLRFSQCQIEPGLRNLYNRCRRACWFQFWIAFFAMGLGAPTIHGAGNSYRPPHLIREIHFYYLLFVVVPVIALGIVTWRSYSLHAKGMRELSKRSEQTLEKQPLLKWYLMSGMVGLSLAITLLFWIFLPEQIVVILLLLIGLCFAISNAAYAIIYRRLANTMLKQGV